MKKHVVPRDWEGQSVAIVASGPSVESFDFTRIAGLKTIAVKDGYLKVPHADVLMIGDHRYARRTPDLSGYLGPLILYTDPAPIPEELHDERVRFIPKVAGTGLSRNPAELRGTFTTTTLAINYAVLRGSPRIYLIGVDMQPGPDGQRWAGRSDKEGWPMRYKRQAWGYQRQPKELKALGVKVFNCNPKSALKLYPFLKEGECLA